MSMDASIRPDMLSARPPRYRLTLLPRPDVIGRDSARTGQRYRRAALIGDGVSAAMAALLSGVLVFGVAVPVGYWFGPALLTIPWLGLVTRFGGYREPALGAGRLELGVLSLAGGLLVAAAATVSFLLRAELSRGYVLVATALAGSLSLASRQVLRHWRHQRRRRGLGLQQVLVVGHAAIAAGAIEVMDANPHHGYVAVAACLPSDGVRVSAPYGIPIAADISEVMDAVTQLEVDAVALVSDLDISGLAARRLLAALTTSSIPLLAANGTAAASGAPHAGAVHGLPLVTLAPPKAG